MDAGARSKARARAQAAATLNLEAQKRSRAEVARRAKALEDINVGRALGAPADCSIAGQTPRLPGSRSLVAMGLSRLAALILMLLAGLVAAEIPSYIEVCGRRNPRLSECVIASVRKLLPKLKVGIPELRVPPLEPLTIDNIDLARLPDFSADATNVTLFGLSDFDVHFLTVDMDKQQIDFEVEFPKIVLNANYDVRAKILVPITDKGPIRTISENVIAKITMKYQIIERRGRKIIYYTSMTTKLTINNYEAEFDSDTGERALTQIINSVLQDSQKEIIESMTPNIERAISIKTLDLSNRIVKQFDYDELFPDRA